VKAYSALAMSGGSGADSGPFRGDPLGPESAIEASKAASRNGCFTSTPAVSRGAICDKKILAQRETWGARFLWRVPACADFVPRPRPSLIRGPIREFGKARALLLPPP
jgi:hypothetical protein